MNATLPVSRPGGAIGIHEVPDGTRSTRKGRFTVMYRAILVPLDGSRKGTEALNHASQLATELESELILIRVVPPPRSPLLVGVPTTSMLEMNAEAVAFEQRAGLKKARNQLNSWIRKLKKRGVKTRAEVQVGDPATLIKQFAESSDADLIVMTTRGRSGASRAFLGSVADEVVRSGVAPVLLLHR